MILVVFRQAADKNENSDTSAMKEGQRLFLDKVEALSHCFQGEDFFSGSVEASMKKNVSYSIKFALSKSGDVLQSSCDCPAGEGPHSTCKHVVAGVFCLNFS